MGSFMFYEARGGTPSSDLPSRVSSSMSAHSRNNSLTHLRGGAVLPSIRALATRASRREGAGGILAVLGVAAAVAVIIFPLARWHASLTNSAAGLKEGLENTSLRLEMVSAMEDRWHQINDMDVAEFKALTSAKETKYGKFTVKESFGAVGKYNASTGQCDAGTPGTGDRACRVATLTVTSEDGTATLGPVQAIRVATSDDRLRNLEGRMTAAENKFGQYYTAAQVDAKVKAMEESGISGMQPKMSVPVD